MIYRERSHRRSVRYQNLMLGLYQIDTELSSSYLLDILMLRYLTLSQKGEEVYSFAICVTTPDYLLGVFIFVIFIVYSTKLQ